LVTLGRLGQPEYLDSLGLQEQRVKLDKRALKDSKEVKDQVAILDNLECLGPLDRQVTPDFQAALVCKAPQGQ